MTLRRVIPSVLLAAALVLPSAGCSQDTSADRAFGAKVRAYLLAHPEIIEEAMTRLEAQKDAAAAKAAVAGIAKNRAKLEHDAADFVANPNGRVTVVEFFDYKCPYCKTSAAAVVKLIHDNPDVRFVFKEFPILSDASRDAAADQLLTKGQGHYLEVFQGLMSQPALSDETTLEVFKAKGVNLAVADSAGARADVAKHLADNRALAHEIGVDGTPAFIVGAQRIDGWDPEHLQAGIDAVRRAPSQPAG